MPRPEHKIREKVRAAQSNRCFMCGAGPLHGRALRLIVLEKTSEVDLVMGCCGDCFTLAVPKAEAKYPTIDAQGIKARVKKVCAMYDALDRVAEELEVPVPFPKSVVPSLDEKVLANPDVKRSRKVHLPGLSTTSLTVEEFIQLVGET